MNKRVAARVATLTKVANQARADNAGELERHACTQQRARGPRAQPKPVAELHVSVGQRRMFVRSEAIMKRQIRERYHEIYKAVMRCDVDGSGTLSEAELRAVLYRFDVVLTDAHFADLVTRLDQDGDGYVSYAEFMRFWGKGGAQDTQMVSAPRWQKQTRSGREQDLVA